MKQLQFSRACAAGLLSLAIIVAPLCLGASGEWPRFALEAAMATAAILWAASSDRQIGPKLMALLVATVSLVQVVPLSDTLLTAIAPVSGGAWKVAHQGSPGSWGRISIDPAATLAAGRRTLVSAASIVAIADLARDPLLRRLFIAAAGIACAAIVTLGLAFPVSRTERIVLGLIDLKGPIQWHLTPLNAPIQTAGWAYLNQVTVGDQRYLADGALIGDGFGPYLYSNHFAGGMSLTLPSLIAMWLMATGLRIPKPARIAGGFLLFGTGFWVVAMLAQSRAGALSLTAAGMTMAWLLVRRPWLRTALGWMLTAYVAGVVALIVMLLVPIHGLENLAPESFRTVVAKVLNDPRVMASHVAFRMFWASPFLGAGLGTYDDLFPRFAGLDHLLYFAHNDYAQLLAEAGLCGGAIAGAFAVALARRLRAFTRGPLERSDRYIGAAAWAALAGIGVHSAFDWNLHLPANGYLACAMAGLGLASSVGRSSAAAGMNQNLKPTVVSRFVSTLFQLSLLVAMVLLGRDAHSEQAARGLRRALTEARLSQRDAKRPSPSPMLGKAIEVGEQATAWDRWNATLPVFIGQAYLHKAAISTADVAAIDRVASDTWFRRARMRRAVCRGLPEQVVPQPAPNKPSS